MPAANLADEAGNRYGRLVVLQRYGTSPDRKATWMCRCDCGNLSLVKGNNLRSGRTTSCGCFQVESSRGRHMTHGLSRGRFTHPAYHSYHAAKARCTNPNHKAAGNYSQRGIKFMLPPFEEFWEAMKGTWAPGLTLDRKDNDGHYEMGNIRWASRKQQALNTRRQRVYILGGKEATIEQLAEMANVPVGTMRQRIYRHGVEAAVVAPHRYTNQKRNERMVDDG